MSASWRRQSLRALVGVGIWLSVAVMAFPLYWGVVSSFKQYSEMFQIPPTFFPQRPTLSNYVETLQGTFLKCLLNTAVVAVASTLLAMLFGVPAAYAFSRFEFPLSRALFFLVLAVRMVPPVAFMVPLYLMTRSLGLYNTRTALAVSYLTFQLPFVIWMLEGFLRSIPRELEEAARIDGASRMGVLWRVILPLAGSGLAVSAVFAFIMAWNEFPYALVLTSTSAAKTAPVNIAESITAYQIFWGRMTASGTLFILPVLAFSTFVQRYMVKAIVTGALKG